MADIKPDNILVNWTRDEEGNKIITNVALGDFDITYKCETGALIRSTHAVGNAIWRSPEGQTGRGMCKVSDIYSFGLVVSYSSLCHSHLSKELTLSVRTVHIRPRGWGSLTPQRLLVPRRAWHPTQASSSYVPLRVLWISGRGPSETRR